jgi:hypothetical protein
MECTPAGRRRCPAPCVRRCGAGLLPWRAECSSLVNAVTNADYNVAVQLSIRAVVYLLVTLLIVRLRRGKDWVRLALTVLLGGVGVFSLPRSPFRG